MYPYSRHAPAGLVILLAALLLAACGIGSPSSATSLAASSAAGASDSASADASPSGAAVLPRPDDLPTDGTCEMDRICLGLLEPGQHRVEYFDPPFTFEVAEAGWENLQASGGEVSILPLDAPGDDLFIYQRATPLTYDGKLVTGIGHSAEEFAAWLVERDDLDVSDPQPASVGGLIGTWVDISVHEDATSMLRDCPTSPCVAIAHGTDPAEMPTWGWDFAAWRGAAQRIYILASDDTTVLLVVTAWDATQLEQVVARMQPIIDSIEFAAG